MYIICFGSVVQSVTVTGVAALNKPPESLSGREVTRSLESRHIIYYTVLGLVISARQLSFL